METLDGAADKNIPIITIIHKMKEEGGVNYKTLRKEASPFLHCASCIAIGPALTGLRTLLIMKTRGT